MLPSAPTRISAIAAALMLLAPLLASAERNVTVWPTDASVVYEPNNAWSSNTMLGQLPCMETTDPGAKLQFSFTGSTIFAQIMQGPDFAVARINLDGTDFVFDTASSGNSVSGAVWGIVSLPDEQHLISITHNDTAGTKLSVTAFVYTSTTDLITIATSPLSRDSPHYARNAALVTLAVVLGVASLLVIFVMLRRKQRERRAAAAAIHLDVTPVTPTSSDKIKTFGFRQERPPSQSWQVSTNLKQDTTHAVAPQQQTIPRALWPASNMEQAARTPPQEPIQHISYFQPTQNAMHSADNAAFRQSSMSAEGYPVSPTAASAGVNLKDPEAVRRARQLRPLVTGHTAPSPPSGVSEERPDSFRARPTQSLRASYASHAEENLRQSYDTYGRESVASKASSNNATMKHRSNVSSVPADHGSDKHVSQVSSNMYNDDAAIQQNRVASAAPSTLAPPSTGSPASHASGVSSYIMPWAYSVTSSILPAGFNVIRGGRDSASTQNSHAGTLSAVSAQGGRASGMSSNYR